MPITTPRNWEHASGYRLDADGKAITYHHADRDLEAYIEATVNEHTETMEYRPSIIDTETGEFEVYPDVFTEKDRAIEQFQQDMEQYS